MNLDFLDGVSRWWEGLRRSAHIIQPLLQLGHLGLFDHDVLFVEVLNDDFVMLFGVDGHDHGLDGSVAFHQGTCR